MKHLPPLLHKVKFIPISLFLLFLITPCINAISVANPTISSKAFFFISFLTLILGITLCALPITRNPIQLKFSKIDIVLVLLVVFIVCNRYFIQSGQGFSIRFIELLGLSFLYILLRNVTKRDILFLFLAIVLSGAFQAIYGAMQLLGYLPMVNSIITGSFQNSGPYAGFLAAAGCLAFGVYLFKESFVNIMANADSKTNKKFNHRAVKILEYISFIGIASIVIILPATLSRAAWLAICVGLIGLLIYKYKRLFFPVLNVANRARASMKIFLGTLAFLLLISGGYLVYQLKKDSADGRILVWKVTVEMIKDKPFFGVGYDRFKTYYMETQAAWFGKPRATGEVLLADNTYYAFNEALQLLAENGTVGFIIACIATVLCFRVKVDAEFKLLKYIAIIVVLSIYTFGMFSYPMQILPIKMILVLFLALLASIDEEKLRFSLSQSQIQNKGMIALRVVVVCVSIIFATNILLEIKTVRTAFKDWQQALTIYNYESYQESLGWFEKAYPILNEDGDFLMNYGKALTLAGDYQKAKKILQRAKKYLNTTIIETALGDACKALKQYDEAEIAYTKASRMTPNRFYSEYLLAKLYYDAGQKEKAHRKAKEILDKSVKVPSKAIEQIHAEMKIMLAKTRTLPI